MSVLPWQCYFFQSFSLSVLCLLYLDEVSLNTGLILLITRTRTGRGCLAYTVYNKEHVVGANSLVGSVLTLGVVVLQAT